jgi:prevent-host-death family protein
MTEVGVHELHDHLSAYLRRVQDGERIVVTNRGHRVALLLPTTGHPGLDRLIAEGKARPPLSPKTDIDLDELVKPNGGTVSEFVKEQRR